MIKILFFGRLSESSPELTVKLPDAVTDLESLKAWLSAENTVLGQALARPGNRAAINQDMMTGNAPVNDGDEIAFMSPLSGG
ncbi:MAG: MoaD/ThiS family protein [Maricaulaceae bacterium]